MNRKEKAKRLQSDIMEEVGKDLSSLARGDDLSKTTEHIVNYAILLDRLVGLVEDDKPNP